LREPAMSIASFLSEHIVLWMESASIHRRGAISSWYDQGHGGELEEA
jgi:hypothetical protein